MLQDVPDVDAWGGWQAEWRDTFVLDRDGNVVAVYNLTVHDLSDPGNQAELVEIFDAAID